MKRGNSRLLSISYVRELFNNAISKDYGFNYHEIAALVYIKAKGTVSQSMLVKRLRMDKSSVTKIVNKFVDAGLVKRDFDPLDLRYRVIMPTEKLMEINIPKSSFTDCFFEYVMQDLSKEEIDVIYRAVSKIYNRAKAEQRNDFEDLIAHVAKTEEMLRASSDDFTDPEDITEEISLQD
ncbi:MAG: MarR family winged helix-turn-helix transcriptional regulator [Bacillota bacterium]